MRTRTPGYSAWQQPVWLTHCDTPCAFLGDAGREDRAPILDEVMPASSRSLRAMRSGCWRGCRATARCLAACSVACSAASIACTSIWIDPSR
ncbi:CbrC family protein [Xanthomonas sp. A2111]|uniref:CbrC family protein n=1 Tax=Xanthomonas hawaiiensis TaxID=3003247 RepID=A0ABU2IA24_9XANT|nr:CbrC family protein [Xanthomonas sp. A2111]MDS9994982.1 CbrC family protein [Xanthomonas sp. A2111]